MSAWRVLRQFAIICLWYVPALHVRHSTSSAASSQQYFQSPHVSMTRTWSRFGFHCSGFSCLFFFIIFNQQWKICLSIFLWVDSAASFDRKSFPSFALSISTRSLILWCVFPCSSEWRHILLLEPFPFIFLRRLALKGFLQERFGGGMAWDSITNLWITSVKAKVRMYQFFCFSRHVPQRHVPHYGTDQQFYVMHDNQSMRIIIKSIYNNTWHPNRHIPNSDWNQNKKTKPKKTKKNQKAPS